MTGHFTGGGLCSLCGTRVNNSDESQYLRGQAAKAHETSEQEILPPPQNNKCTASHYTPSSYFPVSAPHLLLWSEVSLQEPSNLLIPPPKKAPRSPPIDYYFFSLASLQTVHTCTQEIPYHGSFGTKTSCTSCFIHVIFTHSAILFVFSCFV